MSLTKRTLAALPARRQFIILAGLYLALLVGGLLTLYLSSLSISNNQARSELSEAKKDLAYNSSTKQWDTSRYNADPNVPGAYRVYVIDKSGFVIDRWRPISGFLDTSDFKQLLSYQSPEFIPTVTGQTWRVYSKPLQNNSGSMTGVIYVGLQAKTLSPQLSLKSFDLELLAAADFIGKEIAVVGAYIDTSKVANDNIPYNVSFQVVDQFNRVRVKSDYANTLDRLPNSLDPSYIAKYLQSPTTSIIRDANTGEKFFTSSSPIFDKNGQPIAVIVVARSLLPFLSLIKSYFIYFGGISLLIVSGAMVWQTKWKRSLEAAHKAQNTKQLKLDEIENLKFIKSECLISVNSGQHLVNVGHATNQYYMCLALFSAPKKKWKASELLDRFGIANDGEGWRKIYDAMNGVNKKCSHIMEPKLFIMTNRSYHLNPALSSLIS